MEPKPNNITFSIKKAVVAFKLENGMVDVFTPIKAEVQKVGDNGYLIIEEPKNEAKARKHYKPLVKNQLATLTRRDDGRLWIGGQMSIDTSQIGDCNKFESDMHEMLQQILDEVFVQKVLAKVISNI